MSDDTLTPEQVAEQIRTAERAFHDEPRPWWLVSLRVLLDENNKNADLREQIRCLTDALREAKPALLRGANQFDGEVADWSHKTHDGGIFGDPCECCDQLRADAAVLRALAEMGEER